MKNYKIIKYQNPSGTIDLPSQLGGLTPWNSTAMMPSEDSPLVSRVRSMVAEDNSENEDNTEAQQKITEAKNTARDRLRSFIESQHDYVAPNDYLHGFRQNAQHAALQDAYEAEALGATREEQNNVYNQTMQDNYDLLKDASSSAGSIAMMFYSGNTPGLATDLINGYNLVNGTISGAKSFQQGIDDKNYLKAGMGALGTALSTTALGKWYKGGRNAGRFTSVASNMEDKYSKGQKALDTIRKNATRLSKGYSMYTSGEKLADSDNSNDINATEGLIKSAYKMAKTFK